MLVHCIVLIFQDAAWRFPDWMSCRRCIRLLQVFAAQAQGAPAEASAPQMQQQEPPASLQQVPSPAYNGIAEQGLPPRKRKAPGRD